MPIRAGSPNVVCSAFRPGPVLVYLDILDLEIKKAIFCRFSYPNVLKWQSMGGSAWALVAYSRKTILGLGGVRALTGHWDRFVALILLIMVNVCSSSFISCQSMGSHCQRLAGRPNQSWQGVAFDFDGQHNAPRIFASSSQFFQVNMNVSALGSVPLFTSMCAPEWAC